ncbi:MAG: cellulase family glycosylhydrolase [Fibrobacter sp.]|nr:cellulase family glycosylhydrolase [Fibrobacter sp.]
MTRKFYRNLFSCIFIFGTTFSLFSQTPVQKHGWLKTQGKYLLNEKGNIVQLKGMSFFWSRSDWYNQGSSIDHFYSSSMVNLLVDQWKCTVLRVAYSTDGGSPQGWNYCQTVIDAAIAKGIYVIIDWHAHDAHNHESQAVSFFTEQAQKYLDVPNVIFEPYNEPTTAGQATPEDGSPANAIHTWEAIKPYLTNVTKAIRNTGSKNLIVLGTPYYCQHVGVAGEDPVTDNGKPFENVAYSYHFYAASHGKEAYYYKVEDEGGGQEARYLENGVLRVPVFVSEWGTSHSNGGLDGKNQIDETNTDWWFENWIDKYHLSWCNWSVSDWQASSAFSGGTGESNSGRIVRKYLNNTKDEFEPPWVAGSNGPSGDSVFTMPNRHAAVSYNKYYGTNIIAENAAFLDRDTSDVNGSKLRWLKVSEGSDINWVEYNFNLSSSTRFFILRYLAKSGNGTFEIHVDGEKKADFSVTQTDSWKSDHVELDLSSGKHNIKLYFTNTSGSYNLNWLELASEVSTLPQKISLFNSASPVISNRSNSIQLVFPESHSYSSFSLIQANGSIYKNEKIKQNRSNIQINNLSSGIWFLKLNGLKGPEYSKIVITGK